MAVTRSRAQLNVGARVITGTKRGTIRFIGPTEFATGEWIGIELDDAEGKNDGSVNGVRYFECPENHGLFVKRAQVRIEREDGPVSARLEEIRAKRAAAAATQEAGTSEQPKSPPAAEEEPEPASPTSPVEQKPCADEETVPPATPAPAPAPAPAATPAPSSVAASARAVFSSSEPAKAAAAGAAAPARSKAAAPGAAATRVSRTQSTATVGQPARPSAISPTRSTAAGMASVRAAAERKSLATSAREQSSLSPKRPAAPSTATGAASKSPAPTSTPAPAAAPVTSVPATPAPSRVAVPATPGHVSHVSEDEATLKLKYMLSEKDAQLVNAMREISRLEGEVESLRMEVVTAKSQADKVVNKGEAAAKDAQSKVQAMEELSAAHASAQEQIRQLTEQLSAFEALQQESADLQTRLLESDTNLRVLQEKLRQTEGDEHTRNAQFAKDKAAMAADKRKIQDLEQQVMTLTESLEMLTLDKEQLAVDKEILEDNVAELETELATLKLQLEVGVESAGASNDQELSEQNERLKEALRRLRDTTSQELEEMRKKVRAAEKDANELAALRTEVTGLREWKQKAAKQIEDLQEQVDESAAYQDLLEKLTERNMTLSDRISQQNIIVADLESAQEIYEELDATQKQEIQGLRREIEEYELALKKRGDALLAQEKQIQDLKQDLQRYKAIADKLRRQVEELSSQAAEDSEKLEAVRGHAKSALSIKQQLSESRRQAANFEVSAKLHAIQDAAAIARIDRVEAMMSLENVSTELHACGAEVSLAKCIATSIAARDLLSRNEQINEFAQQDMLYVVAEGKVQHLLIEAAYKARTAVTAAAIVHGQDKEPLSTATLLALGSKFQQVEHAIAAILKNEVDLVSQQGRSCVQALEQSVQDCTLHEIADVPAVRQTSDMYRAALHLSYLAFAAQHIGEMLQLFLRSGDLSEDSQQSISSAHQECMALAADVQRACAKCALEPSLTAPRGASDLTESSQELSAVSSEIGEFFNKLGDLFAQHSTDPDMLLSQVMDLVPTIAGRAADVRERFQALGNALESKLPSIPNLFSEPAAWGWLKPSTQHVQWRARVAKVRQELEHKFSFEEAANATKEQLASTAAELDLKLREVSALQTRIAETQEVLESYKTKQPEIEAMRQESDRRYVENVELAQENKALQEAIEIFEKKIEAMEAERRRTNATSKAQGRGGDFLTSDMLQTMRDTFSMLRDDACVWRLVATKSLMNGLADLPAVGGRMDAVPSAEAEADASEGAEEQKATDFRAGLAPHQATAEARRVYRDARLQRARVKLVDLTRHKSNARSAVVSQQVAARKEFQALAASVERVHRSITQDQTAKFHDVSFSPDIAIQLPDEARLRETKAKLVGRVVVRARPDRKSESQEQQPVAVRCVVDQIALSKLLRVVA